MGPSFDAVPPISMVLLNVSSFLPNQILMAIACLGVFATIRLWTYRSAPHMWVGPFKVVALVNLWMFLTVSIFVISGLYEPLRPWQPAVHMLEEIGTMGTFIYLAIKMVDLVPTVVNSLLLELLLKSSVVAFPACWVAALVLGYIYPFPMTGLLQALPPEAFAYRALLLSPGLFYTGMISALILRGYLLARTEGADPPYRRRLGFFLLGSLAFFITCMDHLAWAYIQAFAPAASVRLLAPLQVVAENVLWGLIALFWVLGIVSPYERSATDRALDDHKRFLRRLRVLKDHLPARAPTTEVGGYWRGTLDHIRRAARDPVLRLCPRDEARAEKVFELVVANAAGAAQYKPDHLLDCDRLYTVLMKNLPESSPERTTLASDPLATALRPAAHALHNDRTGQEVNEASTQPRWAQLGYAAAAELGLLHTDTLPRLDPSVVVALRRAKRQDDEPIAL